MTHPMTLIEYIYDHVLDARAALTDAQHEGDKQLIYERACHLATLELILLRAKQDAGDISK